MTWPSNDAEPPRRWVFLIELDAGAEPLLRAVGHFPAQGAEITRLALTSAAEGARLEVEVLGLDQVRAERLQARIAVVPSVRSVGAGWRLDQHA